MNKYDQERIDMIIVMIMYITGFTERKISSYVRRTKTFLDILNGDELTLYDSYAANLMDMVNEWKEKAYYVPFALRNITEEKINDSNSWLRVQKVRDSRQAKLLLPTKQKYKLLPKEQKSKKLEAAVVIPGRMKIRIDNRSHKAPITTGKTLSKDI